MGLGLSVLLHLLLLTLALTLIPALMRRYGTTPDVVTPEVLTFQFNQRVAPVDESSRTQKPQDTPLVGRNQSEARDRLAGGNSPVPGGAERSIENSRPGDNAADASSATPSRKSTARPPMPDAAEAGLADALGSGVSVLTGHRSTVTPRRAANGHGARTDADDAGALQFGDYSFSTREWDYEPYWAYMRDRLYANWHPPAAYADYGIIDGGYTIVRAVLERNGRLRDAHILETFGHESLHPASLAAMLGAAPFRPLPSNFPEDSLVVTVRFMYLRPGEHPTADPH